MNAPRSATGNRTRRTTIAVLVFSALVVLACIAWAVAAQHAVPDACSYPSPPAHAQYVHCD